MLVIIEQLQYTLPNFSQSVWVNIVPLYNSLDPVTPSSFMPSLSNVLLHMHYEPQRQCLHFPLTSHMYFKEIKGKVVTFY